MYKEQIAKDTLPTQSSTGESQNKESYSVKRDKIEGTPFDMVQTPEGYVVALGHNALMKPQKTANKALSVLEANKWDVTAFLVFNTYKMIWGQDPKAIEEKAQENTENGLTRIE